MKGDMIKLCGVEINPSNNPPFPGNSSLINPSIHPTPPLPREWLFNHTSRLVDVEKGQSRELVCFCCQGMAPALGIMLISPELLPLEITSPCWVLKYAISWEDMVGTSSVCASSYSFLGQEDRRTHVSQLHSLFLTVCLFLF